MSKPRALMLLPDIPGHFHALASRMAEVLCQAGTEVVFAVTSPYYPHFKGVDLAALGPVEDLSEYLAKHRGEQAPTEGFDRWATYSTFVRRSFFAPGQPLRWEDFHHTAAFLSEVFERRGPFSVVWSENVSNAFLHLGYLEAQRRGCPFYGYISSRLPGTFNVALEADGPRFLENLEAASAPAAVAPGAPEYMANPQNDLRRLSLLGLVRRTPGQVLRGLRSPRGESLEVGHPLLLQSRALRILGERKVRHWITDRVHRAFREHPDLETGQINVLFPLHYRPEASTSVLARHYADDVEVVRNIAFSLPARAQLVVKEHRSAIGLRRSSFYREIARFPGVCIAGPDFPLAEQLERFDAVVTLTSTVGFEALQKGIPVYVLGKPFYMDYPGAIRVPSFEALDFQLKRVRKREGPARTEPAILERYRRICFPGSFNYIDGRVLERDNVARLASPLLDVLRTA